MLRGIVNNGWTIANRRAVSAQIGKNNFNEIATLVRKTDLPEICYHYNIVSDKLNPNSVNEIIHQLKCYLKGIDVTWNRKLNLGRGHMNSEFYPNFRATYVTGDIKSLTPELRRTRRALFENLQPLGCDKIHYRGEVYSSLRPQELEHFNKLKNLKVGDKYEPKTNMWISDCDKYAFGRYASYDNPEYRNVQYTILASKDTKVIEMPYGNYCGHPFTEGVYDDRAVFEVCDRSFDGNTLQLWLKHIK